jgi:O-antigen/teichoic acid export membrane protein
MLKQRALVHFGSNVFLHILAMIAGIFVARIAGPGVVGTLAYGTAYVNLWGFIGGLFGSAHIKLVSEGQDIGKCMSVANRLFIVGVTAYFIVVVSFFLTQKYVFNVDFESTTQEYVILILLFVNVFEKLYQRNTTIFTATMEQARAKLPIVIKGIFWHLGRIIIVILGFKAIGLVSWNLIITILLLPLVFKLTKKYPGTGWDKNLFKRYLGYALPSFLIVVIHSIIGYSDKLLLVHFTNTTELGYFSAAMAIGGTLMLFSRTGSSIFFPLFSSFIAKEDWSAVKHKIMQYQEFLSVFVFPAMCSIVIISGPLLITILGAQYEPSIKPFMIIALATYVLIIGMPYGNIISGAGRFYLLVWINIINLFVFVASLTFFVSPYFLGLGATGLALHLLVINFSTNVLYIHFSKQLSGLSFFNFGNMLRHILAFTTSLILYINMGYFNEFIAFAWIIVIPVNLSIIYFMMFVLGLVNIQHFKQISDLINLRKVISYTKSELRSDNNNEK